MLANSMVGDNIFFDNLARLAVIDTRLKVRDRPRSRSLIKCTLVKACGFLRFLYFTPYRLFTEHIPTITPVQLAS